MSAINQEIYDMVYEEEFGQFNRIFNVMCNKGNECINTRCTFAHNSEQLKNPICLYHFSDGCTNSAKTCKFSHGRTDAIKSLRNYKLWIRSREDTSDVEKDEMETIKFHEMVAQADKDIDDAISEVSDDLEEEYALSLIEDEQLFQMNKWTQPTYIPLSEELELIKDIYSMHESEDEYEEDISSSEGDIDHIDQSSIEEYNPWSEFENMDRIDQLTYIVYQQHFLIQKLYNNMYTAY